MERVTGLTGTYWRVDRKGRKGREEGRKDGLRTDRQMRAKEGKERRGREMIEFLHGRHHSVRFPRNVELSPTLRGKRGPYIVNGERPALEAGYLPWLHCLRARSFKLVPG